MSEHDIQVGDWVKDELGREWLVTDWNPISRFFGLEAEDGTKTCEQPEFLTKCEGH